jgi:hypothetical protein
MMIIDPIKLGDTPFTRPSPKWVYDRTGTLVEVPTNTLGVTYDPSDLSKAPWALLEPAATNSIRDNTMAEAVVGSVTMPGGWVPSTNVPGLQREVVGKGREEGIDYIDIRIYGSVGTVAIPEYTFQFTGSLYVPAESGQTWASSVHATVVSGLNGNVSPFEHYIIAYQATGPLVEARATSHVPKVGALRDNRLQHVTTLTAAGVAFVASRIDLNFKNGGGYFVDVVIRIGLPQLERNQVTSQIRTSGAPVTRAADVVGAGAGLLYSNVPITESDYSAAATYAKDALVHDPATHNVFKSLIDANKGKALTDPAAWNPRGATNRWAMLDQYNNTQTAYPEEILIVLTPQAISEGLYIGNCEADEIELSVVDQSEGLVASEVMSLVTASGASSYFDWCFRPADRSDYFVTTSLPPYANALVLVAIRKPGGVPKCGMLAIGGVDDFGPSLYGLSAEGKDYSSTTFNFDGTTNTELRPYAKRMSVDVQVDNGEIDYIQRKLFQIRQRPIVWIGGPYGATAVFGRYGSFKIVIPGLKKSDMALQIEGSV